MFKVLIADDEKDIIKLMRLYLEKDDIIVIEAYDGDMALQIVNRDAIDLVVVDIMMPKMNGFELIKQIRQNSNIPILVISARVQSSDKIFGLELGADDYITKPFDAMEVTARVKAALRRYYHLGASGIPFDKQIICGDLTLDLEECVAFLNKNRIELTAIEFKLLKIFIESPGRVFTKEQIFESVWQNVMVDDNTVRVAISKLRDKIGQEKISTIRGLGYRMEKFDG